LRSSRMPDSPRTVLSFSTDWRFCLGDVDGGEGVSLDHEGWEKIHLPHTWNDKDTFVSPRGYYRGRGWYRKRFSVADEWTGRRLSLEFDAAFSLADVWINGIHLGQFMGGFTGFTTDITDAVRRGGNLIAIRLSNEHDPDVLPGREIPDYDLYGGIYRGSRLVIKNDLYIPQHGITVTTPEASDAKGSVRVALDVCNMSAAESDCTCTAILRGPGGGEAGRIVTCHALPPGKSERLELSSCTIEAPALWSPEMPNLYTLEVTLEDEEGIRDVDEATFGFRWFEFTVDSGFSLNGKPLKLWGMNRHQDYAGIGNALPERLQVRDVEIMKEMGANWMRTSHYPQHPAFLDACDRLGIIVYEEIASWQFIGGEKFIRNAEAMMREMIARDKNHPSILLWGLLNEGRSRQLFEHLNRVAHECDPTRLTIYAENKPEEGLELGTVEVPDVLGLNYKLPHLAEIREMLPGKKLVNSEHTNADFAVRGDYDAEMRQLERLVTDISILSECPYIAGGALWSMHDYGTDYEPVWPLQNSGIIDATRLPKEGYYYLKSRWNREPLVHICGHWNWADGETRSVTVVSNCDEVELFLEGDTLGVVSGEECPAWKVPFAPGTLKAIGRRGKTTVLHVLHTSGPAVALELRASPEELHADGSDMSELTVRVIDSDGTTVPDQPFTIGFDVDAPGSVHGLGGRPEVTTAMGFGRIIVRAGTTPGAIAVRATSAGLRGATVVLRSV
jgi:beta-galactosidase